MEIRKPVLTKADMFSTPTTKITKGKIYQGTPDPSLSLKFPETTWFQLKFPKPSKIMTLKLMTVEQQSSITPVKAKPNRE